MAVATVPLLLLLCSTYHGSTYYGTCSVANCACVFEHESLNCLMMLDTWFRVKVEW